LLVNTDDPIPALSCKRKVQLFDLTAHNIDRLRYNISSGGGKEGYRPGRHCAGGGIWRVKNGIMKFCRFWQIGICIADSDIVTPLMSPNTPWFWDHTPNCQCSTVPYKIVCTPRNLHCWPD